MEKFSGIESYNQNDNENPVQEQNRVQFLCENYLFPCILRGECNYAKNNDEYEEGEDLCEDILFNLSFDTEVNKADSKEKAFEELEKYFGKLKQIFVSSQNISQRRQIFYFFHELKHEAFSTGYIEEYGTETLSYLLEKQKEPKENHFTFLLFLKHLEARVIASGIFSDKMIKKIAPDVYIAERKSKIFISSEKNKDQVEKLIEDYDKNTNKLDYRYSAFRDSDGSWKSYEFKSERQKMFETLFSEPIEKTLSQYKNISPKENIYDYYSILLYKNVSSFIEEKAKLSLNDFSLRHQLFLIEYLMHSSNEEADKLYLFLSQFGISGGKTFLSLEHGGKKMADKILSLAELLSKEEAKNIFNSYGALIDSAEKLRERLDPAFAQEQEEYIKTLPLQIHDALLLRAKDVLVGAEKVASTKETPFHQEDVTASVEGVTLLVSILADIGTKEVFQFERINLPEKNIFKFLVTDSGGYQYGLKVLIRPEAEKNAQARINIELSFDTEKPNEKLQRVFLNSVTSHRQHKTVESSVLRIGIDREDFGDNQRVSLDMGRSEHSDDAITRTGDTFGNLLALASESGHHTTEPFDPKLADKEVFKKLALQFQEYIESQASQ